MKDELFAPANKKAGNGNGNSVINNHERPSNKTTNNMNDEYNVSAKNYSGGDSNPEPKGPQFEEHLKKTPRPD